MEQPQNATSTENPKRSIWGDKKKLLLLIGIPLVIGIVAATAIFINSRKNEPVALIPDAAVVDITGGGFTPQTMKVQKGQVVSWTNTDIAPHRLMADPDQLPDFETPEFLEQGDVYTYIFDEGGTFNYYDPDDPVKFVGSIIVE